MLKVAAVIGASSPTRHVALVTEHPDDDHAAALEEGLEGRVIEETERPGRYRFTHALMQETLLDELSTTRRVRLHGRIGEALEQRYGDRAEERASPVWPGTFRERRDTCEHARKALRYSREAPGRGLKPGLPGKTLRTTTSTPWSRSTAASGLRAGPRPLHEGVGGPYAAMGGQRCSGFASSSSARSASDADDASATRAVSREAGSGATVAERSEFSGGGRTIRTARGGNRACRGQPELEGSGDEVRLDPGAWLAGRT